MKIKKIVNNTVYGVVTTSIFASSCTKYNIDDNIYNHFASNEVIGRNMIDINETNLSDVFF